MKQGLRKPFLVLAASIALFSGSVAFVLVETGSTTYQNCHQIEALKGTIRTIVSRSSKSLTTIAYYRDHPAELQAALAQNQRALQEFAPTPC